MSRKALGRGLKALIPDAHDAASSPPEEFSGRVPLDQLRPNPFQPRRGWSAEELRTLAESLETHGLLEPILVRPVGGHFEIIAGERRARAAQLLGWTVIEAQVRPVTDEEALEIALVENLQRRDLNPLEQARGYQALIDHFGWSHERCAEAVGKSRTAVSNSLRLLRLPRAIQDHVSRETLSEGHARTLLALEENQAMQEHLAQECIEKELSVRQLESRVRQLSRRLERRHRRGESEEGKEELRSVQEALIKSTGLNVSISGTRDKGVIKIWFGAREELEGLLSRLGGVIH